MISRLAVLGTLSCFLLSSITKAQEEHLGTHNLRAGKAQEEQAEEDEQVSRRTLRTPVKFDSENIQRVVGGNDVVVGEYPYYVDMDGCGGSLIAPDLILSAAHCGRYRGSFVTVGALYPDNDSTAGATEVKVVRWARHPNYNANTLDNDFAIMQISPPVTLTSSVTFSINDSRNIQEGEDLTVIGLGLLEENANNDGAPILQEGTVQAISHSDCNSWYRGGVTDANMFCAGKEEGGIDSCQGDSGGPIVRKIGNSHVQVGKSPPVAILVMALVLLSSSLSVLICCYCHSQESSLGELDARNNAVLVCTLGSALLTIGSRMLVATNGAAPLLSAMRSPREMIPAMTLAVRAVQRVRLNSTLV
mmetsp:Transcript_38309/g.92674  ORF Transcript_38309/g.92674 Transcript_38309/m.92674 type:complete len:361 (+) Transcript_38309:154-1236(+)